MVIIAATLYLPQHITFLTNRAWFYYNGDESARVASTPGSSVLGDLAKKSSAVVVETVKETVIAAAGGAKDKGSTVGAGSREL
jgi:hypothetical protein